ncbi:MAG: zinc-ribbon domain-containing protein [DPANN group archaeon]|nr:zinc-ribbon domain-containing protein [DPANN group archaeon]
MKRLTIKDMQKLAGLKGGRCSSEEYISSRIKLKWRCKNGHVWETTPKDIKRGSWCPKCEKVADLSINEMHKIAKDRGGKCLSKKYINSYTDLKWCCKKGHEWETTHDSIKKGKWCPTCAKEITKAR